LTEDRKSRFKDTKATTKPKIIKNPWWRKMEQTGISCFNLRKRSTKKNINFVRKSSSRIDTSKEAEGSKIRGQIELMKFQILSHQHLQHTFKILFINDKY
jgi:hypothetical protein